MQKDEVFITADHVKQDVEKEIVWTWGKVKINIENKIIHASGKVRIDHLDEQGIFNIESKSYTHQLKLIKRII